METKPRFYFSLTDIMLIEQTQAQVAQFILPPRCSFNLLTLRLEAYLPEKRFSRRFVIGTLARSIFATYINCYNDVRLNSAIGYITPLAKLDGRDEQIFKDRDRGSDLLASFLNQVRLAFS